MTSSQENLTHIVSRYLVAARLSKSDLARSCGMHVRTMTDKINGRRSWTFDDFDALRSAGVPVGDPFGEFLVEEV